MKRTSVVALAFLFSLLSFNVSHAQSSEDPFEDDIFGDLFSDLESFSDEVEEQEGSDSQDSFGDLPTLEPSDNTNESVEEDLLTPTQEAPSRATVSRSYIKEVPEGKEAFLLYQVPGAFEYNGMTFLNIDSDKYFNPYQPCDLTDKHVITSQLARLKLSQGAPLECREDIRYVYMPYRTYRASNPR